MKAAPKKDSTPSPADAPSMIELTSRWARAKVAEETGKREAESLKKQILAAGAEIGHADAYLVIGSTSSIDVDDKRLLQVLRKQEALEDVQETTISLEKLRGLSKHNEAVARVIDLIAVEKPRFEQAAKRADAS